MTLLNRVKRLEKARSRVGAGSPGCRCGRGRVTILGDHWRGVVDDPDAVEICERCGLPVPVRRVEMVEVDDWQSIGSGVRNP